MTIIDTTRQLFSTFFDWGIPLFTNCPFLFKEIKMANESQDQSFPYKFTILSESEVASLKTIDGKVDPINMVEYKDKDDQLVTPLPLYIPEDQLEAELEKEDENKRPK